MKVFLCGFEPFGGIPYNPSETLVREFEKRKSPYRDNLELITKVLPTEFLRSAEIVKEIVLQQSPDLIFLFGVSEMARHITFEQIATNVADSSLPDNAGSIRNGEQITKSGPVAYQTNYAIRQTMHYLADQGIKTAISYHAGTYVCNYLYYSVLHFLSQKNITTQCVFIHIPYQYKKKQENDPTGAYYSFEDLIGMVDKILLNIKTT